MIAFIHPPQLITEELVVQEMEDELLIYNCQTNRAICLNQTAALVWQSCDGTSSVSEITQKLEKELGASVNEDLILFAISELNKKGLIENGESISDRFKGLSRREIVRKVGFASLVALPIVSSIVAPTAVDAQSVARVVCLRNGENTSSGCGTRTDNVETARQACLASCRTSAAGSLPVGSVVPIVMGRPIGYQAPCCSTNAVPVNCAPNNHPFPSFRGIECTCQCAAA